MCILHLFPRYETIFLLDLNLFQESIISKYTLKNGNYTKLEIQETQLSTVDSTHMMSYIQLLKGILVSSIPVDQLSKS